ncbi:TPA: hypothetical protein ACPD4S_004405, partial [Klebsiella pneumoniae]
MSTYKTKNPLGSAAVKDLYDNAENVDKFVNDRTKEELEDRLGVLRKTWHGMEMIFSRFIDYITGRGEQAVAAIGWQELGNWAVGLAVDNRQQIVYYNGSWYKYLGELEHVIAGDSPENDGGVWSAENPTGKWSNIGDAALRSNLGSGEGFKYIGQVASYAALKTVIPERSGQRILLGSYYANESTGGGEFVARAGTATDDGGTICVPTGSSTWYWQRVGVVDFDVTWFGAIGDSNTANSATNTVAIQRAIDAADSAGIASVTFPKSAGFFACGTIYMKPGVSLVGAGRTRGLLGAIVYLRAGSNAVIAPEIKGLWHKQCHFYLW